MRKKISYVRNLTKKKLGLFVYLDFHFDLINIVYFDSLLLYYSTKIFL